MLSIQFRDFLIVIASALSMHQYTHSQCLFHKAKLAFQRFRMRIGDILGWTRNLKREILKSQVKQYDILRESQSRFLEELKSRRSPSGRVRNDGFKFVGSSFHSQKSNQSNNDKLKSQVKTTKGKNQKISCVDKAETQAMKLGLKVTKTRRKALVKDSQQIYDNIVKGLLKKNSRNGKNKSQGQSQGKECQISNPNIRVS